MKYLFLSLLCLFMSACRNQSPENQEINNEESGVLTRTMTGDFTYYADATVFNTPTDIYGVEMDEMFEELVEKSKKIKKNDYDAVLIEIEAEIIPNDKADGWPENIRIKKILHIEAAPTGSTNVLKKSKE